MSDSPSNSLSLRPWMVLSVALNIFLVGAIVGGAWRWWAGHVDPPPAAPQATSAAASSAPRGLRFAADGLAPPQRQAFRAGLREARKDAADQIRTGRESRAEVVRLLGAPSFERAALAAALGRARAADVAVRERVEAHVIAFASTLTPAERATFTEGLMAQAPAYRAVAPQGNQ